jgi:N-acetylglucosamine kinase-like BadF-type ATPase
MVSLVAGVDVGGSKTLAAVADREGRVLGVGAGPGGNRQLVGAEGFRRAVDEALGGALALASAMRADLAGVYIGAAGLDFPEDGVELRAVLADDLTELVIENDALLGLYAGTSQGWGGVVVGGSGTNAAAVAPDGTTLFVGGMGWHAGDTGGASMLGVEAVRAAIRSWEGRERATLLTDLVIAAIGAADMAEVFRRVSTFDRPPDSLAVAPLVAEAARRGDELADGLLATHGRELGLAVTTALCRLGLVDAPDVIGLGGMFPMCASTSFLPSLEREVHRQIPTARVRVLGVEPVVGAVAAALRHAGQDVDVANLRLQWVERWAVR